jgi:nucleotide-binding universal stress UspA family protein
MIPIRTILHPTDFSEHSAIAFQLATSLARDNHARLVIVHVAVPPVVIYDEKGDLLPRPKDYREAAKEQLFSIRPADASICTEHVLDDGEVTSAILRVAAGVKPDLIVMGSLGRTGLDRLLIGSVAAEVLRGAACPVVTVRSARHEEARSSRQ